MKKAKRVIYRIKIAGQGVVNYDSGDQKFLFLGNKSLTIGFDSNENVSYAKKRVEILPDGTLEYKLAISSNCLTHGIFKDDVKFQSPNLISVPALLYSFLASPTALLRGYMFADKTSDSLKRSSSVVLTDAIQTNNAASTVEIFTRSGLKTSDENKKDTSLFKKEVVGKITYEALGHIDLEQMQFLSCDQIFDRYAINPDYYDSYKRFLSARIPNFNSELAYYQRETDQIRIPEYGIKFSDENILFLVRRYLKQLMLLEINRKSAYAKATDVEYKIVYDVYEDTFENEEGWVSLKREADVDAINFEVQEFYELADPEKTAELRQAIQDDVDKRKANNKLAKEAEKAEKAARDADRAAKKAKAETTTTA
jgi:hypothetical protein